MIQMQTLREQIIQTYISENLPNSRIVTHRQPDSGLTFFTEQQLHDVDADWFPLSCQIDPNTGKLLFGGRSKVTHTYTEGETGAGKTTRFAIQSIRALSSMKPKPSFIIVDIHGEIIETLHTHLIEQGYGVKILNCDDPSRSDCYNPFAGLVKQCLKNGQLDNEGYNRIRRIAEIMQPVDSTQDPIWDQGARSYTNGAILDKFEDLLQGKLLPQCVTLYNIIENHYWLRSELNGRFGSSDLASLPHYARKGVGSLSVQKMMSVTNNAEKTRASYFGVVENHYDQFGQPSMYQLSSANTIDVEEFIEKPTAIIIQSGNTNVGDNLISMLVNDIYSTVVRMGKQTAGKLLPRRIHCFLDEFANTNIADGPDFIRMLTTSRKFGMHWHLILQCDAQLDRKFDANTARIIRANCTELFMGSQDYDTTVRFARSCGQKTIPSLESITTQRTISLTTVDLMTADRLNLTQEGHIYIKSSRHPLLDTYFEAFYNCDEYDSVTDLDSIYPRNDFDYRQTRFTPGDIPHGVSDRQFAILRYIHEYRTCTECELDIAFSYHDMRRRLDDMIRDDLIRKENGVFTLKITEQQYQYLAAQSHASEPAPVVVPEVECIFMDDDYNDPNRWVAELKEHHARTKGVIEVSLIDQFTCLPEFFKTTLRCIATGDPVENEADFPENLNVLKFEILEAFISSHDFTTKKKWVETLRKEFLSLKRTGWLPAELHEPFQNALNELDKELTLSNIREIRKIIKGSED